MFMSTGFCIWISNLSNRRGKKSYIDRELSSDYKAVDANKAGGSSRE